MVIQSVQFAGLVIALPGGWYDITNDLPEGTPYTLARTDGIGALQFSTVRYVAGPQPHIQTADLRKLLEEFAGSHGLGEPATVDEGSAKNLFVVGDFSTEREFIRVWYVTNGRDVVLVSYVTQEPHNQRLINELRDADKIVASLSFV